MSCLDDNAGRMLNCEVAEFLREKASLQESAGTPYYRGGRLGIPDPPGAVRWLEKSVLKYVSQTSSNAVKTPDAARAVKALQDFRGGRTSADGDEGVSSPLKDAAGPSPIRSETSETQSTSARYRVLALADHEILQIINIHASTPPRLYPLIEDAHLRFSEADQDAICSIVGAVLPYRIPYEEAKKFWRYFTRKGTWRGGSSGRRKGQGRKGGRGRRGR